MPEPHFRSTIRHQSLHRALEELLGCWQQETGGDVAEFSILDLLDWSSQQTSAATCEVRDSLIDDELPF